MDFLTDNIKSLYRKFLFASMASALAMSVYSFVDTIAVGQTEGTVGAAAMAVITPIYELIVFLGILCGVGGAVLMSNAKGEGSEEKGNAYFTASVILMAFLAAVVWVAFALFSEPIFIFFGADATTLPKVMEYAVWLIRFFPVFIAPIFIGSFIRNDGAPGLAMAAVVIGGCVNVFGDWLFCFPLGMGMKGAALATVTGTSLQVLIMCSRFFSKKCRLALVKPSQIGRALRKICSIGFGASILDLGAVALAILINNQITKYGGNDALSVYGIVGTISSLFQALFCGVGQAIQPLVSSNDGAGNKDRVHTLFRLSMFTVIALGAVFTALGELLPLPIINLFMSATPEVIAIAPTIIRIYFLVFLFMGITVLSTYYLQSVMRSRMSVVIAALRSLVVSGLLLFILPLFFDLNGVLLALPVSELIVAIIALVYIKLQWQKQPYN